MITDVRHTLQAGFETPPAVGLRKSYSFNNVVAIRPTGVVRLIVH